MEKVIVELDLGDIVDLLRGSVCIKLEKHVELEIFLKTDVDGLEDALFQIERDWKNSENL